MSTQEKPPVYALALNTGLYIPDYDNKPYQVVPIEYTRRSFPGGEVFVQLKNTQGLFEVPVLITARIKNSDDLMALLMLTDALRRAYVSSIDLKLYYVPYARQDRVTREGESASLEVFAALLNAQNYEHVQILEPHSDVAPALLQRDVIFTAGSIGYSAAVREHWEKTTLMENTTLIVPDAGAEKRSYRMAEELGITDMSFGRKHRDLKQQSGVIIETVVDRTDYQGRDVLIVDDICDGGRTFTELAQALRKANVGRVGLMVTHGIFSAGLGVFQGLIDVVYTTNSFRETDDLVPVEGVELVTFRIPIF